MPNPSSIGMFPRTGHPRAPWANFPDQADQVPRALAAARAASIAWATAERNNNWDSVDGPCLVLAVYDKAYELNALERPNRTGASCRRLPPMDQYAFIRQHRLESVDAWRLQTNTMIDTAYEMALKALPMDAPLRNDLPPRVDVARFARTLLDMGFARGADAFAVMNDPMPSYDPRLLGVWDQHVPDIKMLPPLRVTVTPYDGDMSESTSPSSSEDEHYSSGPEEEAIPVEAVGLQQMWVTYS